MGRLSVGATFQLGAELGVGYSGGTRNAILISETSVSSRRLLDLRCSGSDAPIVTRYRASPRRNCANRDACSPPARAGSFIGATSPFAPGPGGGPFALIKDNPSGLTRGE